jgi:hypothetical protein
LLRYYIKKDLSQQEDQAGGRRVLAFVGFKKDNPHVIEARKEEAKGYWDEVQFISCPEGSHQPGYRVGKSHQSGIRSPPNRPATAGGQDPPTLVDSGIHDDGNAFHTPSSCSFVQGHNRPGDGGSLAYEEEDDGSFPFSSSACNFHAHWQDTTLTLVDCNPHRCLSQITPSLPVQRSNDPMHELLDDERRCFSLSLSSAILIALRELCRFPRHIMKLEA